MKRNMDFRNINPHFRPTHREGVDIMLIVNEERMNTYSHKKSTQIVLDAWRNLPDYKKDEYKLMVSMENRGKDDGLRDDLGGVSTVDKHLVVAAPVIGVRSARYSPGRERQIHERKGSYGNLS
jgi:hypothetical protein